MKRLGWKHTKSLPKHKHGNHHDCAICHPVLKGGKKRERRNAKKDLQSD